MRGKRALVKTLTGLALVYSLFGLLSTKVNAFDIVMPSGLVVELPHDICGRKHCNWIEIDKNSGFQIIVDCYAKEKEGCGKVYVDKDGDGKVDIEFLPSGVVLILPKGEEKKGISKWIRLDDKKPYRIAFICKSNCPKVYVDKNGDGVTDEIKFSSGETAIVINPQQPQKTKSESASVPQKHYNWIKPNRYSDWQCAYELTYDGEVPEGFKLYVDIDGDNKPDYKFGYYMDRYYASSNSFTYIFYRKDSDWPVSSIYDSWKKVLNVCAPMAIRKFFYERNDTWDDPSTFEEMNLNSDYNYIKAKFLQ